MLKESLREFWVRRRGGAARPRAARRRARALSRLAAADAVPPLEALCQRDPDPRAWPSSSASPARSSASAAASSWCRRCSMSSACRRRSSSAPRSSRSSAPRSSPSSCTRWRTRPSTSCSRCCSILGGVFGAQFGARAGRNLRAELFRFLLAILLLAVGMRFAIELILRPNEPFSHHRAGDAHVRRARAALAFALLGLRPGRRRNPDHVAVEPPRVDQLELHRLLRRRVRRRSSATRRPCRALRPTTSSSPCAGRGNPSSCAKRSRWGRSGSTRSNRSFRTRRPSSASSRRARSRDHARRLRSRQKIGLYAIVHAADFTNDRGGADEPFRDALLRLKTARRPLSQNERGVAFLTPAIFRAGDAAPATAPPGNYDVEVDALRRHGHRSPGRSRASSSSRSASSSRSGEVARDWSALYGAATAGMALAFGWLASDHLPQGLTRAGAHQRRARICGREGRSRKILQSTKSAIEKESTPSPGCGSPRLCRR